MGKSIAFPRDRAARLRWVATLVTIAWVAPVFLLEGIEAIGALRDAGWDLSETGIATRDLIGLAAFWVTGIGAIIACWRLWAGVMVAGIAAVVFVVAVPDGAFVLIPLAVIFGFRLWAEWVDRQAIRA